MRWFAILIVFLVCALFTQNISAQQKPDTAYHYAGDTIVIGQIVIDGNKVTKDKIIFREIEFKEGDKLTLQELDSLITKSSQNLMNRSLFNFVTIGKELDGKNCVAKVTVTERWYIWPIPIIDFADRNFNVWWESKDFSRLNYGVDLRIDNFRGRMERLNFIIQAGYDKKLAAQWTIPYLTKNQVFGMGVYGGYQLNKEAAYDLQDNKPVFYSPEDGYAKQWGFALVDFTFRQKFNFLHVISLGYDHYNFADSLLYLNPDFAYNQPKFDFFSIGYMYKMDFRDYKPYPLVGYYFDAGILKQGLSILSDEVDLLTVSLVFDQYINIYKRWYFAYNLSARLSNQNTIPYFMQTGIGYKGWEIRGYEYYVIEGQYFGLFKSNFKFEIIPRKVHRIKWIKTEKFGKIFYALYANIFFDMGYAYNKVYDVDNELANQWLWGTGLGIDFVTYYDLVIRFEYTFNKQKDQGFFINLVAPI